MHSTDLGPQTGLFAHAGFLTTLIEGETRRRIVYGYFAKPRELDEHDFRRLQTYLSLLDEPGNRTF